MKGIYITLTHSYTPNTQATSAEDSWLATETCQFVSSLTNRMTRDSTVIIDVKNKKLLKARMGELSYENMLAYVEKSYPEKYKALMDLIAYREGIEQKVVDTINEMIASEQISEVSDDMQETQEGLETQEDQTVDPQNG